MFFSNFTDPEDDLDPFLMLDNPLKQQIMALDVRAFFRNEDGKDLFAWRIMPAAIKEAKAERFALCTSTWIAPWNTQEDHAKWLRGRRNLGLSTSLEFHPNRREQVMILVGDKTGDFVHSLAEIIREGRRLPRLSDWEDRRYNWITDHESEERFSGRMIDPAMAAITGRRVIRDPETIDRASAAMANSEALRKAMAETFIEMGFDDPFKLLEMGEEEAQKKAMEMWEIFKSNPERAALLKALEDEHLEDAHMPAEVMMIEGTDFLNLPASIQRKLLGYDD